MATLNGVEFGILGQTTTVIHDNNITDIPGSDTVVKDDAGYSTAPMRVTGHVKNEFEFDNFKGEFYSGGELLLIADPDSGKQYTLYASGNVTELDGNDTYPLSDIVFQCAFFMKNPYLESVTDVIRTKTITTNNQEWSADDSASDIDTGGNVDAVPDIQVTGGVSGTDLDISQLSSDTSIEITSAVTAGQTFIPAGDTLKSIYIYVYGLTDPPVTATLRVFDSVAMTNELGSKTQVLNVPNNTFVFDPPIDIGNKDLMYFRFDVVSGIKKARFYLSTANPYSDGSSYSNDVIQAANDFKFQTYTAQSTVKDAEIYNTENTTIKCTVTNDMLYEAVHKINTDGTGTVEYNEDFSTGKYRYDSTNVNCSCDDTNNELDIADDGYIYWKCDAKYPITGIPTLTSQVNITAGTPTIQISSDGSTWYDIDTAIVDDVDTEYPLDSDGNLSLAGETLFYFRFDCVKASAATCSVKSFELDIDIHTIYAKNPVINRGGSANTFRCDQDSGSGMACEVSFIYPARWWA